MLHLLRPSSVPTLRRLVAALLALMMGVVCAEPLLADSCDGDAPREAVASLLPHVGETPVLARVSLDTATRGGDVIGAVDAPGSSTGNQLPGHTVHVCHCTHAHGGTLAVGYVIGVRTHLVTASIGWRPDRLPPGPALEPQLRPPALPHAA